MSQWMQANEIGKEVSTVAATIDVEYESGVYSDPISHHRGYYAGDFSQRPLGSERD